MDDLFESIDNYDSYSDYLDSRLDEQDLDYLGVIITFTHFLNGEC